MVSVSLNFLMLFGLGLIFLALGVWVERLTSARKTTYRQLSITVNQIVRQTADQEVLLDRLMDTFYQTLPGKALWLWHYDNDRHSLSLSRYKGDASPGQFWELPVDVAVERLADGVYLTTALPESALRQGLLDAGITSMAPLIVEAEFVGLFGLQTTAKWKRTMVEFGRLAELNVVIGQLALIIKQSDLKRTLNDASQKLQRAYRRIIDTQEEERRSLAIKLHDEILGQLTVMGLTLRRSQKQAAVKPEQVHDWLEGVITDLLQVNRRLREITQGLYPSVLTDLGLVPALRAYLDTLTNHPQAFSTAPVITLTVQGFGQARIANQKLACDLYYMARQAVDNALAHAQAQQIFIHLRWRETTISLTVQDDGCGMKAAPETLLGQNGHLGLLSMQERALVWQGRLDLNTLPGQGTTVYARLPIDQPSCAPTDLQAFTYHLSAPVLEVL